MCWVSTAWGGSSLTHSTGRVVLVNPEGELLCTCGGEKQLVYVTIADDTEQFRQAFPTCRDVKISLYRKLYEDIF